MGLWLGLVNIILKQFTVGLQLGLSRLLETQIWVGETWSNFELLSYFLESCYNIEFPASLFVCPDLFSEVASHIQSKLGRWVELDPTRFFKVYSISFYFIKHQLTN